MLFKAKTFDDVEIIGDSLVNVDGFILLFNGAHYDRVSRVLLKAQRGCWGNKKRLDRKCEHIRKASKRSLKRVLTSSTLDKELPNETRIEVNARASILGAVVMFSADKSVKRMMGAVENNKAMELPTAETLKEFMR